MIETVSLACAIAGLVHSLRSGGLLAPDRALRHPEIHWGWKAALAVTLLPRPGPFDGLATAAILRHLHVDYLAADAA